MNFLSIQFALFLTAAVLAFHLSPRRYRHIVLLVASYAFYFVSSRLVIFGIFGATVFTFVVGRALDRKPSPDSRKNPALPWMAFGVAALVCYLGCFKVIAALAPEFAHSSVTPQWLAAFVNANPLLPLGISYYTFRLISYVVDVYWEKIPAERSFIDFASYVAFFPHIVAGPIQRSGEFLEQIRNPDATPAMMTEGLRRMLLGCFKKLVIADNLGILVGMAYPSLEPVTRSSTLLAFYLYPLQLYADFSALTGYRRWSLAAVRRPLAGELQSPLLRHQHQPVLEALAYVAHQLADRLRVLAAPDGDASGWELGALRLA